MNLISSLDKTLVTEMLAAAKSCSHPIEEQGGIILNKDEEFLFVKVKNIYEGTGMAAGLYETDQNELSSLVLSKVSEGWKFYASFHTHPQFSPAPSSLDLGKLFQGFKQNIIFSPIMEMFSYSEWFGEQSLHYYIPTRTLEVLVK
jgi:proteasome lid subunit RPN8/RPN11